MIRSLGVHKPRLDASAYAHDSAEIIGRVRLGRHASVWPLVVLRGDVGEIRIGDRSNIQDLTVAHPREGRPVLIGRGVTVGHRVVLHGCRVGDGALIGMGAVVMEADIGAECLVAAGSLVLAGARFPARSLVMGSPARAVRRLKPAELRSLKLSAASYVRHAAFHARRSKVLFP